MKPELVTESILPYLKSEEYVIEPKYDGHRIIIIAIEKSVRAYTRQKKEIWLPTRLKNQLSSLELKDGDVLDGEIWHPEKRGAWLAQYRAVEDESYITIWDCMMKDNKSLSKVPLMERKNVVESTIGTKCNSIMVTQHYPLSQERLDIIKKDAYEHRKNVRSGYIHGVVIKKKDSVRHDHPKRSPKNSAWMKILFPGIKGWEPRSLQK